MSLAAVCLLAALTACGGGGSSSAGTGPLPPTPRLPTSTPTPHASPTAAPTPPAGDQQISGIVDEFDSGAPVAGATVALGSRASACVGWSQCGIPKSPVYRAQTGSDGRFTIDVPSGEYLLTVTVDPNPSSNQTFAILHRSLRVAGANADLGTVRIAHLTSAETAWIAQLNADRANVASPSSGAAVVDEYAQEQARKWASDLVAGKTQYSDDGYGAYMSAYDANPGAIGAAGGALDLSDNWQDAEHAWFAEKANCPNGDWRTCAFAGNTGHYINLSQDSVVWVGIGGSQSPIPQGRQWSGFYAFDVMTVYYGNSARTATSQRKRVFAL